MSDDGLMRILGSEDPLAKGKSKAAFEVLFDRYGGLVLGYSNRIVRDGAAAEDVTQDVWMKVIQNAGKYEARNQFRPWLLTLTRNTCLNNLRDRREVFDDFEGEKAPSSAEETQPETTQALTLLISNSEASRIRNAIDDLPASQRTAISLLVIENLAYEAIARSMSISVASVKTHIHRGRQTLQIALKKRESP